MKVKAQDSISARELWRDMLQFLRQARLPYLLIVLATAIALARSKIALLIPSYIYGKHTQRKHRRGHVQLCWHRRAVQ